MSTVPYARITTVSLQPGEVMTVSADANASGVIRRTDSSGAVIAGSQVVTLASSKTRVFGTFPTLRHYSIETLTGPGNLNYTFGIPDRQFATHQGNIEPFTGARAICVEDNGKVLRCDDGSAAVVTVPADLPEGFNVAVAQWGAGAVTFTAGAGATKRSSTSGVTAQYGTVSILVIKNTAGTAAEFVLGGDAT